MFEKALEQGRNGQPTCQVVRQTSFESPLDEIDCQIMMNKGRLLNCMGMFHLAHAIYERATQGLVVLLGPKHSKVVAAEKELALMTPSRAPRMSPEEMEQLRYSQNCDQNPSIRGLCINWGSQMHQTKLLNLERERANPQARQQHRAALNPRPDDVLGDYLTPSLMSQASSPSQLSQGSPTMCQLQMPQQSHPFIPTHNENNDGSYGKPLQFISMQQSSLMPR